ncbi:AAA ATPase Elf1 [Malassezia japonica]|uniref:Transcription elongation factor 1 homolog n=1 Tax=Malassezia japonica TaxID=223818 RepID=A0AAF0F5W4_9BASI|nr:AAA ATPase Elf1 [Malassezia japonica]WFD40459.1 AAA ATPase Elf1 [Malassezia japonica]
MGKRKKSTRQPGAGKAKTPPLDTVFTCLFCNHDKAVSCKIDDKARIGYLSCKICGQKFSADTDTLSQPIDVYSYVDVAGQDA